MGWTGPLARDTMPAMPPAEKPLDAALSRRAFALMAAGAALFGCGPKKRKSKPPEAPMAESVDAFGKIKRRIKKHVGDKPRAKSANALLDEAKENILAINKHLTDWRAEMVMLPVEQRRNRALLDPIAEKYNGKMVESLRAAAQNAVDMREHISAEEWRAVFPPPEET